MNRNIIIALGTLATLAVVYIIYDISIAEPERNRKKEVERLRLEIDSASSEYERYKAIQDAKIEQLRKQ